MRVFEQGGKVNFVDRNNVLVGFDYTGDCCEHFGYSITTQLPEGTCEDKQFTAEQLEPYCFVNYQTAVKQESGKDMDEGGAISFALQAPELPDIYVTLFNSHNGYYSHGFTVEVGGTLALDGYL